MKQSIVTLDLEGVLVPEIWIAVAEKTSIPELRLTTRDVPDYGLIYGNPAKLRGWVCACGVKLPFTNASGRESGQCPECGLKYQRNDAVVAASA